MLKTSHEVTGSITDDGNDELRFLGQSIRKTSEGHAWECDEKTLERGGA